MPNKSSQATFFASLHLCRATPFIAQTPQHKKCACYWRYKPIASPVSITQKEEKRWI